MASSSRYLDFFPNWARRLGRYTSCWKVHKPSSETTHAKRCSKKLKQDITALPILVSPPPYNTLYLYLVVSSSAVSSVLVHEEGKKQYPVYFTNRTLKPAEERYQVIKKLVLILIFSARWLHHYFRSFEITICTNYPSSNYCRSLS